MSISTKLKSYLNEQGAAYKVHKHPAAFTSQEIAEAQHIPGEQLLKAVIIRSDTKGSFIMCVITSNQLIDFSKLAKHVGTTDLELANEEEVGALFPDYELGAEPPFGNLYGLKVIADPKIQENMKVFINGGTHTDLIEIATEDYISLAQPELHTIGMHI